MSIIKSLILHRADLCVVDSNKNNIVITTARSGQLFTLHFLLSLCPTPIVQRLLKGRDIDGHSALEWAAYNGHVHIIEYLLYRGMDANEVDYKGRNVLHWAASQNQVYAVAFLLALGMDPTLCDADGNSVVSMSRWPSHRNLKVALSNPGKYCGHRAGAAHGSQSTFTNGLFNRIVRRRCKRSKEDDSPTGRVQAAFGKSNDNKRSGAAGSSIGVHPARNRKNQTRIGIFLFYVLLAFSGWFCLFFFKFYISIPAIIVFWFLMNRAKDVMYTLKYMKSENTEPGGLIYSILTARETHVGFFFGSLLFYIATISVAFLSGKWDIFIELGGGNALLFWNEWVYRNFYIAIAYSATLALTFVSLAMLVFICPDPGAIHEDRDTDYLRLLADVAENGADPDTRKWCIATMQRKPFRAKYDDPTGLLVARHDHHCVWLNNTIGYGNHRLFMLFIVVHLFTHILFDVWSIWALVEHMSEMSFGSSCEILGELFSTTLFGLICMSVFSFVCVVGLALLTYHQTKNIMDNMTTNERINWRRYPWLTNEDGEFFNQFDTGSKLKNTKLFWKHDRDGAFHDYYHCYDIRPEVRNLTKINNGSNDRRKYGKMDDSDSFELETNPSDVDDDCPPMQDDLGDSFDFELDIA
uniref:Palmitoyltransferase n=1 Tax=Ditylum brightwellii TaxID=49249 RepID=A0A6V2BP49_9STRA